MANPVTWFEIIGKDSVGLQRFYRETFGWQLTPPVKEMGNYSMFERGTAGSGIAGGFGEGDARTSIYIEVADPQAFVDKAVRGGATLQMPVTEITPGTTIAMLSDPAGNTFGILKAAPVAPKKTTRKAATKSTKAKKKTTARKAPKKAKPAKRTRRAR